MTITIQIGNSDDKLPQSAWAAFVSAVRLALDQSLVRIHFDGAPPNSAPWQNHCWVIDAPSYASQAPLRNVLRKLRADYSQNSIAWTEGQTVML